MKRVTAYVVAILAILLGAVGGAFTARLEVEHRLTATETRQEMILTELRDFRAEFNAFLEKYNVEIHSHDRKPGD